MMVSASPKYWPGSRASFKARSTMAAMPMPISVAAVMYQPSGEPLGSPVEEWPPAAG